MSGYTYRGTIHLDDPLIGAVGRPSICHGARGTIAGYGRHVRRGERPCDQCREAMNAYNRARRQKWESTPSNKAADRMRRKAKARAWAALARRHRDEYQMLLRAELGRIFDDPSESGEVGHGVIWCGCLALTVFVVALAVLGR